MNGSALPPHLIETDGGFLVLPGIKTTRNLEFEAYSRSLAHSALRSTNSAAAAACPDSAIFSITSISFDVSKSSSSAFVTVILKKDCPHSHQGKYIRDLLLHLQPHMFQQHNFIFEQQEIFGLFSDCFHSQQQLAELAHFHVLQ